MLLSAACAGNHRPVHRQQEPAPTASAARPAPGPDAGATRALAAPIGTDRPTVLIAASAGAHWVAHCEAREDSDGDGTIAVSIGAHGALLGDRMQPFLTLADGRSFEIDQLAAFDPTGRWVVVVLAGRLTLFDAISGTRTDLHSLGVDSRGDGAPYRGHRALAFDPEGRAIAYVRKRAGAELVIVRDLVSGHEAEVSPAPGDVWRLDFEPTGRSLLLHQSTSWASERQTRSPCVGPVAAFPARSKRSDPVVTSVAPRSGGAATAIEGFVGVLSAGLVVRSADGRLLLQAAAETELAPASCGARLLHADARRDLLVVACTAARGRSPLELVGPGIRQPLGIDVAFLGHDHASGGSPRMVPLHPAGAPALLDLDQRRLIRLQTGDSVVVTSGTRALVHRRGGLMVLDTDSGSETQLIGSTWPIARTLATGSIGVVAPLVADAAQARLLGTIDAQPLAVASDGRVLITLGGDPDADKLAVGPLAWRTPTPVEATGTER
jgi:hypothetical protein